MKMKSGLIMGLLLYAVVAFSQEKQLFQTTQVFDAAEMQRVTVRIPALSLTLKGTLLAFCEARLDGKGDWTAIDIMMRRSTDGGNTWSEPTVIAKREESGKPTSNAVPIIDKNGTIHFMYQRSYERCYYIQSVDDGLTWSKPVDITYAFEKFKPEYNWKVLAPGPGHGIQLKNGRLLVPVWLCIPDPKIPGGHRPSSVATIYSDDHGKTWKRGDIISNNGDIAAGSTDKIVNPNESVLVLLADGSVMINMRTESIPRRRRLVSYSPDGATKWTKPVFDDELFDPICMASMISFNDVKSGKRNRILFCNPDSEKDPSFLSNQFMMRPRKNLTLKLSYDEGKSWPIEKVIEPGSASYSDMAVAKDGTIYILYEHVTGFDQANARIMLARLNISWLTDGKDSF